MATQPQPNSFFIPCSSLSLALTPFVLVSLAYVSFSPRGNRNLLHSSLLWLERMGSCKKSRVVKVKAGWIFLKREMQREENDCHPSTCSSAEFLFPLIFSSHCFYQGKESSGNSLFPLNKTRLSYVYFQMGRPSSLILFSCEGSPELWSYQDPLVFRGNCYLVSFWDCGIIS